MSVERLIEIMALLRDPVRGCPWDLDQDFSTIAPYTIEEAYEVADAIDRDDMPALCDELGDLLFQVVYHAQLASEQGAFDFQDVSAAICTKMIRRHPHVFGPDGVTGKAATRRSWERIKAQERKAAGGEMADDSLMAGIGQALPALVRADKIGRRAATVGFDWTDAGAVAAKVREELEELEQARAGRDRQAVCEELGDLLLSVVSLARHLGVDAEESLRQANRKFEARFRLLEQAVGVSGRDWTHWSADELDAAWRKIKGVHSGGVPDSGGS